MTSVDHELDPALLSAKNLTLYRLAKADFANLSGVGAARYPGRWNRRGQEAIYTSTEKAATVLERLVHTPKSTVPTNLAMMEITLSGEWKVHPGSQVDRTDGAELFVCRSLAASKLLFPWAVPTGFALAVPSVIVPIWNVVLYPQAPGFWNHVSLKSIEPFEFDPRLFPDPVDA